MLPLGLTEDLFVTVPRRYLNDLLAKTEVSGKIMAPIRQGDTLGTLSILLGEQVYRTEPLTALEEIPLGSFFRRIYDKALLFLE
jgi:D-alanyl-D-alanine carboxypeptidase (penicillin-binding protein 5/6)